MLPSWARMREVEYDQRIAKVVLSDEIVWILKHELAVAIAVTVSPRLALLTDPAENEAVLIRAIHDAMAALTVDTKGVAAAVVRQAAAVAPGNPGSRAQRWPRRIGGRSRKGPSRRSLPRCHERKGNRFAREDALRHAQLSSVPHTCR